MSIVLIIWFLLLPKMEPRLPRSTILQATPVRSNGTRGGYRDCSRNTSLSDVGHMASSPSPAEYRLRFRFLLALISSLSPTPNTDYLLSAFQLQHRLLITSTFPIQFDTHSAGSSLFDHTVRRNEIWLDSTLCLVVNRIISNINHLKTATGLVCCKNGLSTFTTEGNVCALFLNRISSFLHSCAPGFCLIFPRFLRFARLCFSDSGSRAQLFSFFCPQLLVLLLCCLSRGICALIDYDCWCSCTYI